MATRNRAQVKDDLLSEDEDISMSDIPEESEATSGQVLSLARRITNLATADVDVEPRSPRGACCR